MNIVSLNLAEQGLLSQVASATGLIEERHEHLQQKGVFAEYIRVYECYVELITSETEGLEALKRAVFLCWYQVVEPACFSGLFELPKTMDRRVLDGIEEKVKNGKLDLELEWMLPWYNRLADWVFTQYTSLKHLQSFLAAADFNKWQRSNLKVADFENRGQMGKYWSSLIEASRNQTKFPNSIRNRSNA